MAVSGGGTLAVEEQVVMAVERWRWRNVEDLHPELAVNGSGRGAMFERSGPCCDPRRKMRIGGPNSKVP